MCISCDPLTVGATKDATLVIDLLCGLPNCNGRIAATGMCLGGHLVCPELMYRVDSICLADLQM